MRRTDSEAGRDCASARSTSVLADDSRSRDSKVDGASAVFRRSSRSTATSNSAVYHVLGANLRSAVGQENAESTAADGRASAREVSSLIVVCEPKIETSVEQERRTARDEDAYTDSHQTLTFSRADRHLNLSEAGSEDTNVLSTCGQFVCDDTVRGIHIERESREVDKGEASSFVAGSKHGAVREADFRKEADTFISERERLFAADKSVLPLSGSDSVTSRCSQGRENSIIYDASNIAPRRPLDSFVHVWENSHPKVVDVEQTEYDLRVVVGDGCDVSKHRENGQSSLSESQTSSRIHRYYLTKLDQGQFHRLNLDGARVHSGSQQAGSGLAGLPRSQENKQPSQKLGLLSFLHRGAIYDQLSKSLQTRPVTARQLGPVPLNDRPLVKQKSTEKEPKDKPQIFTSTAFANHDSKTRKPSLNTVSPLSKSDTDESLNPKDRSKNQVKSENITSDTKTSASTLTGPSLCKKLAQNELGGQPSPTSPDAKSGKPPRPSFAACGRAVTVALKLSKYTKKNVQSFQDEGITKAWLTRSESLKDSSRMATRKHADEAPSQLPTSPIARSRKVADVSSKVRTSSVRRTCSDPNRIPRSSVASNNIEQMQGAKFYVGSPASSRVPSGSPALAATLSRETSPLPQSSKEKLHELTLKLQKRDANIPKATRPNSLSIPATSTFGSCSSSSSDVSAMVTLPRRSHMTKTVNVVSHTLPSTDTNKSEHTEKKLVTNLASPSSDADEGIGAEPEQGAYEEAYSSVVVMPINAPAARRAPAPDAAEKRKRRKGVVVPCETKANSSRSLTFPPPCKSSTELEFTSIDSNCLTSLGRGEENVATPTESSSSLADSQIAPSECASETYRDVYESVTHEKPEVKDSVKLLKKKYFSDPSGGTKNNNEQTTISDAIAPSKSEPTLGDRKRTQSDGISLDQKQKISSLNKTDKMPPPSPFNYMRPPIVKRRSKSGDITAALRIAQEEIGTHLHVPTSVMRVHSTPNSPSFSSASSPSDSLEKHSRTLQPPPKLKIVSSSPSVEEEVKPVTPNASLLGGVTLSAKDTSGGTNKLSTPSVFDYRTFPGSFHSSRSVPSLNIWVSTMLSSVTTCREVFLIGIF